MPLLRLCFRPISSLALQKLWTQWTEWTLLFGVAAKCLPSIFFIIYLLFRCAAYLAHLPN